ncbi:PRC-barrel domain-containing protein [Carboxydothermus hydrogenoformans]|uniref:PRC-barrel domain-containing protein n=1 Tax=Carboxydothermus hydrogenoformans TaxID=129958 RepID=UPI000A078073|nr:PRC-barrel domain-containing protein [Carboxydothermus hydrogenoformans]
MQGLPVITAYDGIITGTVKELLVEPYERKVAGLLVVSRNFLPGIKLLPFNEIKALSEKVVLIKSKDALKKPDQSSGLVELWKKGPRLFGQKVIAEDGSYLGQMVNFTFELSTGDITEIIIAPGLMRLGRSYHLESSYILTIGKDAVVVKREGREALTYIPGKISHTFSKIKENLARCGKAIIKKQDD